jgi:outer membrane protein OmpA-like peptidoglycan-associated protein
MATEHESTGLASSLTDLMTSLAVIFILLLVATLNNAHEQGQNTRNAIISELAKELKLIGKAQERDQIQVKPDEGDPLGLVIIVPHNLLNFAVDRYDVPPDGQTFLRKFAPIFVNTVCSERFKNEISSVVVEGHTDPSGSDEHNVQLSQNRATSVAVEVLKLADPERQECFEKLLSVSGRGKAEVLGKELSKDQMAEARRVQFKVRVRSSDERVLTQEIAVSRQGSQ